MQMSIRENTSLVLPHSTPDCLADGILTLLADADRRKKMTEYGLKTAQRDFQWKSQVPHLLDAYQTVVGP